MIKTYKELTAETSQNWQEKALLMVNSVIKGNGGIYEFKILDIDMIGYSDTISKSFANPDITKGFYAIGFLVDNFMDGIAYTRLNFNDCAISIRLKESTWEHFCNRLENI